MDREGGYLPATVPYKDLVNSSQYDPRDSTDTVSMRWPVYDHADEPVDSQKLMLELAVQHGLTNEATVLDAGCGRHAGFLIRMLLQGHEGPLIGVDPQLDPSSPHLRGYMTTDNESGLGITALQGPLEETYIRPGSVDLATIFYALYHMPVEATLGRMPSLLAPRGLLALATSGAKNKEFQHEVLEVIIADKLGVSPPGPFNAQFNTQIADEMLPQYFEVVEKRTQYTTATFDAGNIHVLMNSLRSMRSAFRAQPSAEEFSTSVDELKNVLLYRIDKRGPIKEKIHRSFYLCQKLGRAATPALGQRS